MAERMTERREREHRPGYRYRLQPVHDDEQLTITLHLNRETPLPEQPAGVLRRQQFQERHAAHPDAVEATVNWATKAGLVVDALYANASCIKVSGKLSQWKIALPSLSRDGGAMLHHYHIPGGKTRRGLTGKVELPQELKGHVTTILGFDTRPIARPHFHKRARAEKYYKPQEVGIAYGFPESTLTGKGQCIGIIELGGGFTDDDLDIYFNEIGVPRPKVVAYNVGARNNPSDLDSSGEVMLDIQVAGANAPGAKIVVYFANNSTQGFVDAINAAVHDSTNNPSVISVSWGSAERDWLDREGYIPMNDALKAAATLGVSVFISSGDHGSTDAEFSTDQLNVDFPGSSPWATCCGGTTMPSLRGGVQTVWNSKDGWATGGGYSALFDRPSYQAIDSQAKLSKAKRRGVPDISADAASSTGYWIRDVDGSEGPVGGTSAVSPLWAAFVALINEGREASQKQRLGFVNPILYALHTAHPELFVDVTSGNNDTRADADGSRYGASVGWDECTGLGTFGPGLAAALLDI